MHRKIICLLFAGCLSAWSSPIVATVGGAFTNNAPFLNFTDGAGISVDLGDNIGDTVSLTAAQLGSFTINRTCNTNGCTESLPSTSPFTVFNLVVSFSTPSPTGGNPVTYTVTSQPTATLTATIARSGNSSNYNGTLTANFDNTQQIITYAGGSFGLVLNDINFSTGSAVSTAQTIGLTGTLTRLSAASPSEIPEPATSALIGSALIAGALATRRTRR